MKHFILTLFLYYFSCIIFAQVSIGTGMVTDSYLPVRAQKAVKHKLWFEFLLRR